MFVCLQVESLFDHQYPVPQLPAAKRAAAGGAVTYVAAAPTTTGTPTATILAVGKERDAPN